MKLPSLAKLEPGKYIVAVSGGVDSAVLLNMLSKLSRIDVVVAHFDHGIRKDSLEDKDFVEKLANTYGVDFVSGTASLGSGASEDEARNARYDFLFRVMKEYGAQAIVTAHHQDDVLETIVMNLARGTGRKGLSPMKNRKGIVRPLLEYSKAEIVAYAEEHGLQWREDSTNQDPKYFRNYIRLKIIPKINEKEKQKLLSLAQGFHGRNQEIDELIDLFVGHKKAEIDREKFAALPHNVAGEVLSQILRESKLTFDRKSIEKLVVALKTLPAGSMVPISGGAHFEISKKIARISGV